MPPIFDEESLTEKFAVEPTVIEAGLSIVTVMLEAGLIHPVNKKITQEVMTNNKKNFFTPTTLLF
jgi:hypothetical protein